MAKPQSEMTNILYVLVTNLLKIEYCGRYYGIRVWLLRIGACLRPRMLLVEQVFFKLHKLEINKRWFRWCLVRDPFSLSFHKTNHIPTAVLGLGRFSFLMVRWVDMLFWFLELYWFQKGGYRSRLGGALPLVIVGWIYWLALIQERLYKTTTTTTTNSQYIIWQRITDVQTTLGVKLKLIIKSICGYIYSFSFTYP